ncbi:hypothetical protein FOZ62_027362 [Perkinsus olseni]|uniref:Uncharacterized protein n=1 Tax=Perkinsus olseni TaxID=32597 RepID=A0A7J6SET4_PEROL|nr:hypothetical protein FOZ62_027362 [Perkinsus olseni]
MVASLVRSLPLLAPLGILTLGLGLLAGPGYWYIAVGMMTLTYLVSGLLLLALWKHLGEGQRTLKIMSIFYLSGATGAIVTALPLAKFALGLWSRLSSSCVMMVPQCCGVDELLPGPVTRCSPSTTPCGSLGDCAAAGMTDCHIELKPSNNGSLACSLLLGWEWVMTPGLIEECSKGLWFLLVWLIYHKLTKSHTSIRCRLLYAMAVGAGFETSENLRYAFPELVSLDYSLWPYIFHLDFAPDIFTRLRFIACLHRSISSFLHVIWTGYYGSYLTKNALLVSIALHGLYDFFGTLSQTQEASGGYTYVNVYFGKIGIFITVALSLQLFADRIMEISEVEAGSERDELPLTRTQSLYDTSQYGGPLPQATVLTTHRPGGSFKTAANVFKECIDERNHVNDWAASMSLPSRSSSATAYMVS